jgi:hypothetical protein
MLVVAARRLKLEKVVEVRKKDMMKVVIEKGKDLFDLSTVLN